MIENEIKENSDGFENIPSKAMPDDPNRFGEDVFRRIKELQVGIGDKVFRADKSGIWLGAAAFADAPFSVDMDGNIVAAGLTATTLETATTGERIVITSVDTNQIQFYDDAALYGVLEVHNVAGTGYITLGVVAGDSIEAGMRVDVDVGASGFNATEIVSNGGRFRTEGNASSGFNNIFGKTSAGSDKYFGIQTVATVDYLVTDLLPVGDPAVSGALYQDAFGAVFISP